MKCVILQPSYIPWRGYFHQIQKADIFVFYDDVQYDKHGWRNRNQIKSLTGRQWLTIPILTKGILSKSTPINEIIIDSSQTDWRRKHLRTLRQAYHNSSFFSQYEGWLSDVYSRNHRYLAEFTIDLTIQLAKELGITNTQFMRSSEINSTGSKTQRLLSILENIGANHYITGKAAQNYLIEEQFDEAKITLEYMEYDYPEYPQLYLPFDGQVSILDLMFMTGSKAKEYIWETGKG
jgi:hypothetical protein